MRSFWRKVFTSLIAVGLLMSHMVVLSYAFERDKAQAEQIIAQYLQQKGLNLKPDTPEYSVFLKDILWGVYPELNNHPNGNIIRNYAANYLNRNAVSLRVQSKATTPATEQGADTVTPLLVGYNRTAAVNYAYAWSQNGGKKRNPAYPDFTENDCTNFVSQVVRAGGVPINGSGSCGSYRTSTQWFVNPSAWWCITNSWAWSTSWSVVSDFWAYHTQNTTNAASTMYTYSQLDQLRRAAQPGDIVQLQDSTGGAKWHSMVVTKKVSGELYFTYHSGPGGLDVVDKPLAAIASQGKYNYWLIRF